MNRQVHIVLLVFLSSSCAVAPISGRKQPAVGRACKQPYEVLRKSPTQIAIVRNCRDSRSVSFPCDVAKIVRHPSFPLAAVFCYIKMTASDAEEWQQDFPDAVLYDLHAFFVNLKTGLKRGLGKTFDVGGPCHRPKPDVSHFSRIWSPKGGHVALLMGCKGPFWISDPKRIDRWISGAEAPWTSMRAMSPAEKNPQRFPQTEDNFVPEAGLVPFHEFEGWISDSEFVFHAGCCDTVDFFSYDIRTGKRRDRGHCGHINIYECMTEKRKELGILSPAMP